MNKHLARFFYCVVPALIVSGVGGSFGFLIAGKLGAFSFGGICLFAMLCFGYDVTQEPNK